MNLPRYVYFGHHKCASTWIDTIIKEVVKEHGYTYRGFVDHETPQERSSLTDYRSTVSRHKLAAYVEQEDIDVISCLAADWSQAEALQPLRGVHVIRDPRDIIVSGYFSHKNSHPVDHLPHMAAHRERLQRVSKEEGLLLEMEYAAAEMEDLAMWYYDHPDILELKMEDLTARPYKGFLEIFSFLGLLHEDDGYAIPDRLRLFGRILRNKLSQRHQSLRALRIPTPVQGSLLLGRVYDHRFEKKAKGRSQGEADTSSHYRKGQPGDWRNHFTEKHVAAFKEHFGDLVTQLEYESDTSWALSSLASV